MEGKFRIYQLMPRTFGCRKWTEGGSYAENGSGKLSDITDRCLAEWRDNLAIDAVWFTGVIAHATKTRFKGCADVHPDLVKGEAGSPYAITDYFDIAPELTLCTPCEEGGGSESGAGCESVEDASYYREKRLAEFDALVSRTHRAGLKV
ncbi:MAG: hypothetical protein HUJ91_06635, partial [Bacteroidales bacterium]|nr:hypothetical protein [Bacteroidales bacterium]